MRDLIIVIYTNEGCPRCDVLKQKLDAKGLTYAETTSFDREKLAQEGFSQLPVLQVNGEKLDFTTANAWINKKEVIR